MSAITKAFAALTFLMLMALLCRAQTIKGTVLDSLGKAVSYASVNVKNAQNVIVAYTVTADKGTFTIALPAESTGLKIEVSSVGFKKASQQVVNTQLVYNFKLSTASQMLKTVTVKNRQPWLRTSGDTLSYKASDFANPQHRVIGDVIKKLPGIDVDKAGKISYNRKPISNLYIGGDNLLDDKYNIATSTIPNKVVDQIQVIENHQPIKMLKNKVVSNDVAINLTIKKDAKLQLIGQETIGAGLPGNYFGELNGMLFKDKFKGINYLKGNNTGYDVGYDLIAHNLADNLARVDNDQPRSLLSLGTAGDPDLPRNRYLLNRSGLLNLNNLYNLKKEVQLRANLSYLRDGQRQQYTKLSEIYLPNDTVRFTELQCNKRRPDVLHGQLWLNINKSNYYLNNSFTADYSHNTGYSYLETNGIPVNQLLKDNLTNIINDFNFIKTIRLNVVEVSSYINHSTEPENRIITPNFNPALFNNGLAYNQLVQSANTPTWFTNNYASFKIPRQYVTQTYKAGFSAQSQNLNSVLTVGQLNNNYNLFSDSAKNNLNWNRNKLYAEANYDIPGRLLSVTASLPLVLLNTRYTDSYFKLDEQLTRLYFNPRFTLKYQSGIEHYFSVNYSLRNTIGSVQDVYRGFILTNYRSLNANNADITEQHTQNAGVGFNFRRAISLFFFSVNAGYTHTNSNNISSSLITDNFTQRIVLPLDNNINSWNFSGNISKYNFEIKTTFSAAAAYQTTRLNQIQNNLLLPYITKSTTLRGATDTKVNAALNFSYKATYTITTSSSPALSNTSKFERLTQNASLTYAPKPYLLATLGGDNYITRQPKANNLNYTFWDAALRYNFTKSKLSLEVTAQNLLNTKDYTSVYLAANVYTSSTYVIPGRILLAKVMFNL